MIINHSKKFIFIHIPKSAGTTVTSLLAPLTRYCDQEIGSSKHAHVVAAYYSERFNLRKHSLSRTVAEIVGPDVWNGYFKFAVVRNPYARLVSVFHFLKLRQAIPERYRTALDGFETVDDFLASPIWVRTPGPDNMFMPQTSWLTLPSAPDRLAMDFVGKVETLQADMAEIGRRIGVSLGEDPPPVRNKTAAYTGPSAWPKTLVRRIEARYAADFDLLGYDRTAPALGEDVGD